MEVGIVEFDKFSFKPSVFPNPIAKNSVITYELEKEEVIDLTVLNLEGKIIQTLYSNLAQDKGKHSMKLNISESVTPGNYILKISSKSGSMGIQIHVN